MTKKKNVLPEDMDLFWSVPSFIDKEGRFRSFSSYFVHSITGDIWSCKNGGRYLVPSRSTGDYRSTGLFDDEGKLLSTQQHRFVLAAKMGSWTWEDGNEVGHANRIRWDNSPKNLFPTTRIEQFDKECREAMSKAKINKRPNCAKLSDDQVREVRNEWEKWDGSMRSFNFQKGEELDVNYNSIYYVLKGKTYTDVL